MSPTKKRQTMQKVARERDLREKRALKQEKREARRAAAAGETPPDETVGETPPDETDGETAEEPIGEGAD